MGILCMKWQFISLHMVYITCSMLLNVGSGLTAHGSSQFIEKKIEGSHRVNSFQYGYSLMQYLGCAHQAK